MLWYAAPCCLQAELAEREAEDTDNRIWRRHLQRVLDEVRALCMMRCRRAVPRLRLQFRLRGPSAQLGRTSNSVRFFGALTNDIANRPTQVNAKLEKEQKAGKKLKAEVKAARMELGSLLGSAASAREEQASLQARLEALRVRKRTPGWLTVHALYG